MNKIKVLFICVHNSARSQMAEALLNHLGGELFQVESAGLEPGELNPLAVEAMSQMGIDISSKTTQSVFDLFKKGKSYNYVITVCDESQSERCPIFPGRVQRLHWSFRDPSALEGSYEEKLKTTIKIRDEIADKIQQFLEQINKIIN
ncbi:MAG: arsenate reductase [Candidatus Cloacimonas sp. SDB]|nr:MAG: arsenate reductase [Candidatus Cloacimonas sp. SDB]